MTSAFAIIPLVAHVTAPGRGTAGFLHGVLVCSNERASANADPTWLVRRAKGVIRLSDVRHERLRRPFPRVEHLRETGVRLKNEAPASNRQRPPENRVAYGVVYGRGA